MNRRKKRRKYRHKINPKDKQINSNRVKAQINHNHKINKTLLNLNYDDIGLFLFVLIIK